MVEKKDIGEKEKQTIASALYETLRARGTPRKITSENLEAYLKPGSMKNVLYSIKKGYTGKELQEAVFYNITKEKKKEIEKYASQKKYSFWSWLRGAKGEEVPKASKLEREVGKEGISGEEREELGKLFKGAEYAGESEKYKGLIAYVKKLTEAYERLAKKNKRSLFDVIFRRKPYEETPVAKIIGGYKQKLAKVIGEMYGKLEAIEEEHAGEYVGKRGRHEIMGEYREVRRGVEKSLKELIQYRPAVAIASTFLFLGIFLLAFSQANLTGFAIGSRFVEVTTTFILGFIFLVLGAVLLLIVLSKHRHILVKEAKMSAKPFKPVKKQAKKKKKSRK